MFIFGSTLCESPLNLGLSVCGYVYFLSQHFSLDWLISFFIFCVKLRDHKCSKVTAESFGKSNTCLKESQKAQNGHICPFVCTSEFFLELSHQFLLILCMQLRDHKYLKLTANFSRKFLLAWKWAKRPKMAQFIHLSVTTVFFSGLVH